MSVEDAGSASDAASNSQCATGAACYEAARGALAARSDFTAARDFYARACGLGRAGACDSLGTLYWNGQDGAIGRDERHGMALMMRACELGSLDSCHGTAVLYEQGSIDGTAVPKAAALAAETYEKLCRQGHAYSCASLADCYLDGAGKARDPKLAKQYLWMAHELGYVED